MLSEEERALRTFSCVFLVIRGEGEEIKTDSFAHKKQGLGSIPHRLRPNAHQGFQDLEIEHPRSAGAYGIHEVGNQFLWDIGTKVFVSHENLLNGLGGMDALLGFLLKERKNE